MEKPLYDRPRNLDVEMQANFGLSVDELAADADRQIGVEIWIGDEYDTDSTLSDETTNFAQEWRQSHIDKIDLLVAAYTNTDKPWGDVIERTTVGLGYERQLDSGYAASIGSGALSFGQFFIVEATWAIPMEDGEGDGSLEVVFAPKDGMQLRVHSFGSCETTYSDEDDPKTESIFGWDVHYFAELTRV